MTDPIAVIRCSEDLVEAFRLAKDRLKLSNDFVDGLAGLTRGHTDKVLGPTRTKNISAIPVSGTLDLYLQVFAVRLVMVPDIEFAQGMEAKWEERNASQYRPVANRVSKVIIERAAPLVIAQAARKANAARNAVLTREHRTALARKAAKTRWRRVREAQRLARCVAD